MNVTLLLNPAARRGLAGKRLGRIVAIFQRHGIAVDVVLSESPGDIERRVAALCAAGVDLVVMAGGDGTVHEAVNGYMREADSSPTALSLIPTGSGNDFAKAAGLDRSFETATVKLAQKIAANADPRSVDLGRCNDRYFANGVGIGFDALVTHYANGVTLPIGDGVYLYGLVRALIHGVVTPRYRVAGSGVDYSGQTTLANIANGPWLGGRFRIAPDANHRDGLLNLVLAEPVRRRRILALLPALVRGRHLGAPEVQHTTLDKLTIESDAPVLSHIDGELMPAASRFEIECLPGALRFL